MSSEVASLPLGQPLQALCLSPDLFFAAVGGRDGMKVVAITPDGIQERKKFVTSRGNVKSSITDVAWSLADTSNGLVAAAMTSGAVAIWDLNQAARLMLATSHPVVGGGVRGLSLGVGARLGVGMGLGGAATGVGVSLEGLPSDRVLTEHQRAVNRVVWHPTDPNVLLSCSQDNTLRLWDKRGRSFGCQVTFRPKSESVRDAQFSTANPDRFAAAFDNGMLQVWDRRKAHQPELKLMAHSQPLMALAWHPRHEWTIATGSRDRTVKTWDLSCFGWGDAKPQSAMPVHTVHCTQPVGRVKWRPLHAHQIATAACTGDSDTFIYDVRHPFVPLAVLEAASTSAAGGGGGSGGATGGPGGGGGGGGDLTTGLQWIDAPCAPHLAPNDSGELQREASIARHFPYRSLLADADAAGGGGSGGGGAADAPAAVLGIWQHVVTCARDGVVRLHSLARARKPRDYISPSAIALGAAAGLAQAHDPVERGLDALRVRRDEYTERGLGVFYEGAEAEPPGARSIGSRSPRRGRRTSGADLLDVADSPVNNSPAPSSWGAAGAAMTGMWLGQSAFSQQPSGSWGAGTSPTLLGAHAGGGGSGGAGRDSPSIDQDGQGLPGRPGAILQILSPAPPSAASAAEEAAEAAAVAAAVAAAAAAAAAAVGGPELPRGGSAGVAGGGLVSTNVNADLTAEDIAGYDPAVVRYLSEAYALRGAPVGELCAHNAAVALACGRVSMCHSWRVLQLVLDGGQQASEQLPQEHEPHPHAPSGLGAPAHASDELSEAEASTANNGGSGLAGADWWATVSGTGTGEAAATPQAEYGGERAGLAAPEPLTPREPHQEAAQDGLYGGGKPQPPSPSGAAGTGPPGSYRNFQQGGTSSGNSGSSSGHAPLSWLWEGVVADFLQELADVGDVQHAVAVCEAVAGWRRAVSKSQPSGNSGHGGQRNGNKGGSGKAIDEDEAGSGAVWAAMGLNPGLVREWYASYVDLLHRLGLWQAANELISQADDTFIRSLNRAGTGVHVNCSLCRNPSGPGPRCFKCASVLSRCAICQGPVRGLYVWCLGCGHGGHLSHMQDWFAFAKNQGVCPTGCGHRCNAEPALLGTGGVLGGFGGMTVASGGSSGPGGGYGIAD